MKRRRESLPTRLLIAGAALATMMAAAFPAHAAPTISVTVVSATRTTAKIKVTGSQFSKSKTVAVDVDQGRPDSGIMPVSFQIKSSNKGTISVTKTVATTNLCSLGVSAVNDPNGQARVSNAVAVRIMAPPCATPKIVANDLGSGRGGIEYTASNMFANGSATILFSDVNTGEFLKSEDDPVGPGGTTGTGHTFFEKNHCQHTIRVVAVDDNTGASTDAADVVLGCS
jgi:hypothetical protein